MSKKLLEPVSREYPAEHVAECLIGIASRETSLGTDEENHQICEGITNLKLQKMLFFSQAAYLALFDGKPLFPDEFEAWGLGPVIPAIYRKYKPLAGDQANRPIIEDFRCEEEDLLNYLENIWKLFGKYSASELVHMSHAKGTPWQQVYNPLERGTLIPKGLIQQYYSNLFKQTDESK